MARTTPDEGAPAPDPQKLQRVLTHIVEMSDAPFEAIMLTVLAAISLTKACGGVRHVLHHFVDEVWDNVATTRSVDLGRDEVAVLEVPKVVTKATRTKAD